jgi:hypothetical protein
MALVANFMKKKREFDGNTQGGPAKPAALGRQVTDAGQGKA